MCVPIVESTILVSQDPTLIQLSVDDAFKAAETYMKAEVKKVQADGCNAKGLTRGGLVASTIVEVAEALHADLIAMTTHARRGLKRVLQGSVAGEVVRNTYIPVLLVHPN